MEEYLWVLKDSELDLIRELEPKRLEKLDEDELLALHKRVRRARNKHQKNYRRGGAKNVAAGGGRGAAAKKGAKSRLRAEAFEEALGIVSDRLAFVAHAQAEQLKAERLARAQADGGTGPDVSRSGSGGGDRKGRARTHEKTSGGKKRDASSKAQGAKRQAKRDNR
ncbi:hypothetical protein SAMN02745244_02800 [Tessaracoccus bendigoensis DSM 12906]|uniref:Uncharacterized protein n=1 Tax=Tessaracoccus bendigoensis DSM 12906 TaxID=1123357 RepID=A0A1M6KEK3_9ACTN|nr:hypothetical protein [Tessaracoccus bendigoensis]SHJ57376.1 hypothetical protein SAMN02745244_02800 [Tessaracoccus bendigoensis DSM 12906]